MLKDDELQNDVEKVEQKIETADNTINEVTSEVKAAAVAIEEKPEVAQETIKESIPEFSRPFDVSSNNPSDNSQEIVHEKNLNNESAKNEDKELTMDKTSVYTPPSMERLNDKKNSEKDSTPKAEKNVKEKKAKKEKKKSKKIISMFIILLLLACIILSFIFGLLTSFSDKIVSGISVNGMDVSKLTKDEATVKVTNLLSEKTTNTVLLKNGEYSKEFNFSDIDFYFDIQKTVSDAYGVGRAGSNIFANNFDVIKAMINKKNIDAESSYNQEKYDSFVDTLNLEIPEGILAGGYQIDGDNLVVQKNCSGYSVESEELIKLLKEAALSGKTEINIPVKKVEITDVDIEKVYKAVKKDAVDATFTTDPYEIHKEEEGIDFAITLEEAKKIASESEGQYTIPLKRIEPSVTVKTLPAEAFPDQLGTFYTSYATSGYNRSNNVELATRTINDIVLMPDEVFSYNSTLGQRTPGRGYLPAGVYVNGKVSTDYGGGICQVSSTLYNAVLIANLEVLDRTSHYFYPGYVPPGQDATVSWGAPDFKFKNNRDYPIRIVGEASSGDLTVSIYGLKKDDDYEIKLESYTTGYISPSTEYEDDPSLPVGTTRVVEGGSSGRRSETYKIYYKDGEQIDKVLVSSDSYHPHNRVERRGTAVPQPEPSQQPAPSETPQENNDADVSVTVEE